jgi:hypothetical protein
MTGAWEADGSGWHDPFWAGRSSSDSAPGAGFGNATRTYEQKSFAGKRGKAWTLARLVKSSSPRIVASKSKTLEW